MTELQSVTELERRIAIAETPQEANALRRKISAIQELIGKRQLAWKTAFEGGKAYCEASAKAGEEWARLDDHGPGRPEKIQTKVRISVSEAGFANSMDATRCIRIGTEMHWQDRDAYYESLEPPRIPTLGGLYAAWREHFGVADENRPWLRLFNSWSFGRPDPAFGLDHPGRIPGQVIQNLNYYYTKPGDLVVDLFAGGGVTIDVCAANDDDYGNRKCKAYDIKPVRRDVKRADIVGEGIPDFGHARLVFLDPPYWKQKRGEYSGDATNLANLGINDFRIALSTILAECRRRADLVALLIGPTQEAGEFYDHAAELMVAQGAPSYRIQVPYMTQIHGGNYVKMAKENKRWLYLNRDLMLWKAEAGNNG